MSPRRAAPQSKAGGTPSWLVVAGVAIVVVIVVIVGVDLISKALTSGPAAVTGLAASGRTRGDANAKVTMVEYSDFQ